VETKRGALILYFTLARACGQGREGFTPSPGAREKPSRKWGGTKTCENTYNKRVSQKRNESKVGVSEGEAGGKKQGRLLKPREGGSIAPRHLWRKNHK